MFIKAFFNDAVYKMDFQPSIFQIISVFFLLGLDSIHFISAHRSIQGYIWPIFYICICHLQAPNLKRKQEKHVFLVIYLPLKLAQLLRLRSLVILGLTWQRGAFPHTVSFFVFFLHSFSLQKNVSFGRSSFSNSNSENNGRTSTTTILIIARVKTQENSNEPFKYAKYITGDCRKKQKLEGVKLIEEEREGRRRVFKVIDRF